MNTGGGKMGTYGRQFSPLVRNGGPRRGVLMGHYTAYGQTYGPFGTKFMGANGLGVMGRNGMCPLLPIPAHFPITAPVPPSPFLAITLLMDKLMAHLEPNLWELNGPVTGSNMHMALHELRGTISLPSSFI